MSQTSAKIEIQNSLRYVEPALQFVRHCARDLEIRSEAEAHLYDALATSLRTIVGLNSAESEHPIAIEVSELSNALRVSVLNRGLPIYQDNWIPPSASNALEQVTLENLGRLGQRLSLSVQIGGEKARSVPVLKKPEADSSEELTIRPIRQGEETELSKLFHSVYGYNYINEFVYYPEKLKEMVQQGKLVSVVATQPSGKLVGHVGLLKWGEEPAVYEACLGIVDPKVKSRGIFGKIFREIMNRVQETPMQYCFFDFVTNHDFSQRLVSAYGTTEMAILVGCQSKATQASLEKLGLGADPADMDRYSLLYGILPRVEHPFGSQIALPENIGEMAGFLLKPLRLSWTPASRFSPLAGGGQYLTQFQPAQGAVHFDLHQPGRLALEKIIESWRGLLRNGYQYASIDVPVDAPGLGQLYDCLAANGFFIAGFMPYHHGERLAFRMQSLGPTQVAFDKIKIFTEHGKRLLAAVRADYERNCLI